MHLEEVHDPDRMAIDKISKHRKPDLTQQNQPKVINDDVGVDHRQGLLMKKVDSYRRHF